jgi:hypothetical protein
MKLNINKLSGKIYNFLWQDPLHEIDVMLTLPDFSQLNYKLWGDWGPMYTFQLKGDDPIEISYNGKVNALEQTELEVNSPMLASERKEFPFMLIFKDPMRGITINLLINHDYELGKVKICREIDNINLYEKAESKEVALSV